MATAEQTTEQKPSINLSFDNTVEAKDAKFRFKKDKLGAKRADVELKILVPSLEGIKKILESGDKKQQDLLLEAIYDVTRDVVGGWVGDDPEASQKNYEANADKYSWAAIANMERADRRSVSIPEETWLAFAEDYQAVMPAVSGKSKEAIDTAVQVYLKKMTPVKTNKKALQVLETQLGIYMENTKKGEEFVDILDLLTRRVTNYLKADEPQILAENL